MTSFSELRVLLCITPTSMNFSFDRLMGLVERFSTKILEPGALEMPAGGQVAVDLRGPRLLNQKRGAGWSEPAPRPGGESCRAWTSGAETLMG